MPPADTDDSPSARASEALRRHRDEIAQRVTLRQFDANPAWERRYGARGRVKCTQDTQYHLDYLIEALAYDTPTLFASYLGWATPMLTARNIPVGHLEENLDVIETIIAEVLPEAAAKVACAAMAAGRRQTSSRLADTFSFLDTSERADLAQAYLDALLRVDRHTAEHLILGAVERGMSVHDVYLHIFQPVQHEVGRLWQLNRITVAQEHFCTAATQHVMSRLYPHLFATERNGYALVMACVGDELHEIGARMVSDLFELAGWDTVYLGANTPPQDILEMVRDQGSDVLGLSVTLTPHLARARTIIRDLRADPDLAPVRVLVGGYPFNLDPDLAARIGADGQALTASEAPQVAARLLQQTH